MQSSSVIIKERSVPRVPNPCLLWFYVYESHENVLKIRDEREYTEENERKKKKKKWGTSQ